MTVKAEYPVLVESARTLPAVLAEKDPVVSALSPNGATIAYYLETGRGKDRTSQICIYTFDGAGKKCHNLPADRWKGYPYQLQWSPDSTLVAFTENPVEFGNDADIWVLEVVDGSFAVLTDDGVVGPWRKPTGTPSSAVDYLPMWVGPTVRSTSGGSSRRANTRYSPSAFIGSRREAALLSWCGM